ncbi:MAG: FprA family A-type flavoprotein [Oscillospiraceae bacterium]|jgi:flavorubredoxin|nr:FprA family A-type flavoprotein [Oscillospiraceae bacterium]
MAVVKLCENVYWVGAKDPEVRNFHGYLVPEGTTYNAYLVIDEKISLIDTVRAAFADELLDRVGEIIDPARIDYLISNHVEPDHSGALPRLVQACPNAKVVTSPNGLKGLRAYYGDALPSEPTVVKTGETLTTGRYTFEFVLMPMVHWPDSMSTYLRAEKILFSNDAFGQHICSAERFDDQLGLERLLERAGDYYANIVLPFGAPVKTLAGALAGLDIAQIAPSHGVMLRAYLPEMLQKYTAWAGGETDPTKGVIVYDTMWGATADIARDIAAEWAAKGIEADIISLKEHHVSTAMARLLEARYIAVGSPTLNRQVMPTVAAFLSYMRGLAPQKRVGRAFGAYGWSGESVGIIQEVLGALKWEVEAPVKVLWRRA